MSVLIQIKLYPLGLRVDVFLPNIDQVGGFTIWSAPSLLIRSREIYLAIKYSKSPPAYWVHTHCKVGDLFKVRTGGNFYYEPNLDKKMSDLILIAGGVGINPIISMIQHYADIYQTNSINKNLPKQVALLYSAQSKEEILFKVSDSCNFFNLTWLNDCTLQDIISSIKQNTESFQYQYFITRQSQEMNEESIYLGNSFYLDYLFIKLGFCFFRQTQQFIR